MIASLVMVAGNEGIVSLLAASLPAAVTNRMPAAPPASIAVRRAAEVVLPPQLLLVATTLMPKSRRIRVA